MSAAVSAPLGPPALGRSAGFEAEPALTLAVLRIAVGLLLLSAVEIEWAPSLTRFSPELLNPPEILGWVSAYFPQNASFAFSMGWALRVSALLGVFGIFPRQAFFVATLSSLYILGLPQLFSPVRHNMHLFWFSAILAVAPCDQRLTLLPRKTKETEPLQVWCGIWSVRWLLATVYFFPGLWKALSSGYAWIFSANLQNQLYFKWYQSGFVPGFRIDHYPRLVELAALGVVGFELTFPLLLFRLSTRVLAAISGLGFHLATDYFMRIGFSSLWVCYVVLLDWNLIEAWLFDEKRPSAGPRLLVDVRSLLSRALLPAIVGAVLLSGSLLQGLRGQMQSWPVACYPTFQWILSERMSDLELEMVHADGRIETYPTPKVARTKSAFEWGQAWQVMGLYGVRPTIPAERYGSVGSYAHEAGRARAPQGRAPNTNRARSTTERPLRATWPLFVAEPHKSAGPN